MAKKGKQTNGAGKAATNTNGSHQKASLFGDDETDFDNAESADFDEISTSSGSAAQINHNQADDIDHEKVEAFRRIASAEEIEEMSKQSLHY